jgi:hypothetical protein
LKKLIILALSCCFLASCASLDKRIGKIPKCEFTKFEYVRGGNVTSASISAENSIIEGDYLHIESIRIDENFGPAVNFHVVLEGFKIKVEE